VKIFSNTTPFIALASMGQLQLLPQLLGENMLPNQLSKNAQTVAEFLSRPCKP
jgi:predicted nucleic acid-binding protein